MAFTWSSLNKGNVPKKADIDEIKSKINQILDSLDKGLSMPYSEFAQRGGMYEYDKFVALRQVIDDLDAIKCNDCDSYNAYEKSAACPLAKMGYCSADYEVALAVDNVGEDTTYNEAYNDNELSANNDTVDGVVYSGEKSGFYDAHNGMDDASENYSANNGEDNSVYSADGACSSDDVGVHSGYNSSVDSGHDISYCNTVYDSQNSTYYTGEKSADNSGVDANHNVTYYAGDDNGYDSSVNSGNLFGDYDSHFNNQYSVDGSCSGDNSGYDSTYRYGYDSTYYSSEDKPHDSGVNDTNRSGYDGTYDSGVDGTYNSGVNSSN